jgi:hypothetical protein
MSGSFATWEECGNNDAGLLCDEAGVWFTRRLPSEDRDLEGIYVLEADPDSREDFSFQHNIGRSDDDSVEHVRINTGIFQSRRIEIAYVCRLRPERNQFWLRYFGVCSFCR